MSKAVEISDRDLILVRLRFLDLLKSFFQDEPDAERMSRWRGIFAALCTEQINPHIDQAVQKLAEILRKKELRELKKEYYELFINPYSKFILPLNAAHYLDGKNYGPSLVRCRELLKQAQLVKIQTIKDSEDNLLIMLDTLISLIEEEKEGVAATHTHQKELVLNFLLPMANKLAAAAATNPKANFYQHCALFLKEYIILEKNLLLNT